MKSYDPCVRIEAELEAKLKQILNISIKDELRKRNESNLNETDEQVEEFDDIDDNELYEDEADDETDNFFLNFLLFKFTLSKQLNKISHEDFIRIE